MFVQFNVDSVIVALFHLLMELHHGLQRGVLVGDAGAVGGGAQAALLVPGVPRH